jgi:two-component system response regulator HydG
MDRLLKYDWPGNVRELMNVIERGVVLSRSPYLDEAILSVNDDSGDLVLTDLSLEEVEKAAILKTLKATGGNKSEAARRLGITRKTLQKKLKKYGEMA